MSFYGGSRLPFARRQNSPKLPKRFPASFEAWQTAALNLLKRTLPRPQGLVGAAGKVHRGLSGAWELQGSVSEVLASFEAWQTAALNLLKRTLPRPQGLVGAAQGLPRPVASGNAVETEIPFMEVQGCRLPAFTTRQTPQTLIALSVHRPGHSGRGEPFLQLQQVPEAVAMSFYGGSRLPFARLQNSPKLPKRFPAAPTAPLHAATVILSCSSNQVPEAVAMSFYGGSRLPFASLHNSPKLPKRFPAAPRRHSDRGEPSCSSNRSLRPWQCPFKEVQGCRLPGFKTRQNSPKLSKRFPAAPRRHSGRVILSCSSNKSLKPWQCPFMEVQGCRLPAFTTRQNSPNAYSTLCSPPRSHSGHSNFCPLPTGHSCSNPGFYGVPRRNRPRQALCSSNKSLRPWQCPFKEVQGCRLPGFKTRQNSPNASLQLPGATQAAVNLSCSSNKSLKPWQCPFMEVQGCRLPGFKTRQNSPKRFPAAPRRHSGRGDPFLQLQQVPEAVAMSFYGGSRLPFASLHNSPKLPKRFPAAPRRHSGRGEPFLQLQQVPEAVAMSFYGGSRLPFARLQNLPKLPYSTRCSPAQETLRPQQFLSTSHGPLMQQSRFLRRSQTQQAAADPVQLQQVSEAVAMSF